ncbi:MAG TPA: hypothetical protein VGR14_13600 [Verrucomicrobiae bacterium]|jgi:hypothetical protein|nr:hypothetical protein [Verrucomicrobiae bacterium]
MSKRNSDWYIPPDWSFVLSFHSILLLTIIFIPLLPLLMNADVRALYAYGLGAGLIGFALLFAARLPLYKERRFWTIGPRQLDRKHRRVYWLAYTFSAVSLLLLWVVWLRTHLN